MSNNTAQIASSRNNGVNSPAESSSDEMPTGQGCPLLLSESTTSTSDEQDALEAIIGGDRRGLGSLRLELPSNGVKRDGLGQICTKRVLPLKWRLEAKRRPRFASEVIVVGEAVSMQSIDIPSDLVALVVEYLDHKTAIRSVPCSRTWWKIISTLPPSCHINTCIGRKLGWQDLIDQLEMIMLCNPSRAVKRVTLGENVKIGSFRCLSAAVGGTLTHLDLTRGTGAKFIDFQLMAEQLPNLRGLAVGETFYRHDFLFGWLRGVAKLAHEVSLESLRLAVNEFSCVPSTDPRSKAKWQSLSISVLSDRVLSFLVNQRQSMTDFFIGDGFMGSDVVALNLLGSSSVYVVRATDADDHGVENACEVRAEAVESRSSEYATSNPSPCISTIPLLSTLRKLWLTAPPLGPVVISGMAALGSGLPMLQELVTERLKVTDAGWREFAMARITTSAAFFPSRPSIATSDTKPTLRRLEILTTSSAFVPSAETRGLLEEAVSERVILHVGSSTMVPETEVLPCLASSGGTSSLIDCEGLSLSVDDDCFCTGKTAGDYEAVRRSKGQRTRKLRIVANTVSLAHGGNAGDL